MLPWPLEELEAFKSAAALTLLVALLRPKDQSKPPVSCAVCERPVVLPKVALSLIMMWTGNDVADFCGARIGEEVGRAVLEQRDRPDGRRGHVHLA